MHVPLLLSRYVVYLCEQEITRNRHAKLADGFLLAHTLLPLVANLTGLWRCVTRTRTRDGEALAPPTNAEQPALAQVADVLDAQTQGIVERWLGRLPGATPSLPRGLCLEGMQDDAPGIVHGVAEALRSGRPGVLDAPWVAAALNHARVRLSQGEALLDLLHESRILREEIWNALAQHRAEMPGVDAYELGRGLDAALDAMIGVSLGAYGAELRRTTELAERLREEADYERRRWQATVEAIPDPVMVADAQGRIVYANPDHARHLLHPVDPNVPPAEQARYYGAYRPDGRLYEVAELPLLRAALRGEEVRNEWVAVRRAGGQELLFDFSASPLRDPTGRRIGAVAVGRDVTELSRAEQALRESEIRFRSLFDNSLDAVFITIPEGPIVAANPAAERMFGWSVEEFIGLGRRETVDTTDPRFAEAMRARARTGRFTGELTFKRRDGSTFPGEMSSTIYRDEVGRQYTSMVIRDITERKRVEQALRLSEERFRKVFEEGPLAMAIVSLGFRLDRVNSRLARLLGYSKRALVGRTLADVTHPEDIGKDIEFLGRLARGEIPYYSIEKRYIRQDGRVVWGALTSALIYDDEGRPLCFLGMVEDITASKQIEAERRQLLLQVEQRATELEALRQVSDPALARQGLEELVRSLLWRTMDLLHADAGAVMLLDQASQELTLTATVGIPAAKVVGARIRVGEGLAGKVVERNAVIKVSDIQAEPEFSSLALRASPVRAFLGAPLPVRGRAMGAIYAGFRQVKRFEPSEELLLSVVAERAAQAIYQSRLLQQAREAQGQTARSLQAERRARRQAEEAVRARDDFLAAAAHELKTPITSLRGYAQVTMRRLQREEVPDPARTRLALSTVDRQSDRLARLVEQLLDVASIEAGRLEVHRQRMDLVPMLRDLVETVQAGARRHTLTLESPPALEAMVDSERIENVAANLLDNAVKFSPPDTRVEVELAAPSPDTVELAVRDYGPGIAPERRAQLFGRFFQAQAGRPFAGLGLGLFYRRTIVELHGGRIYAEFPPEGGSRFVVTLPRG